MVDEPISRLKKGTRKAFSSIVENRISVDSRLAHGQTCMHIAAREGEAAIIERLSKEFSSKAINLEDNDGKVPLHEACIYGQKDCAIILLNIGSPVDPLKHADWTPLMLACENKHEEICDLLLNEGARTDLKNKDGWTPLHLAARSGSTNLCKKLCSSFPQVLNWPSTNMRLCLHTAALHGHIDIARFFLMQNSVDPNRMDSCGTTPLMDSVKSDCVALISLLINHGADVFAHDKNGLSAIHIACSCNSLNSLKFLLQHGVSLNLTTNCYLKNTCMHIAVSSGSTECSRHLLLLEADFETKNNQGFSALNLIATQNILETLHPKYPNARISVKNIYSLNNFL